MQKKIQENFFTIHRDAWVAMSDLGLAKQRRLFPILRPKYKTCKQNIHFLGLIFVQTTIISTFEQKIKKIKNGFFEKINFKNGTFWFLHNINVNVPQRIFYTAKAFYNKYKERVLGSPWT